MVERRRTDVGASQDCRFSAGQRRHRQCAPGSEVNWSAYQKRVNGDESAEGRFTLASRLAAMATTCRKRRISRWSTCSYRSEREQFCHDTLPWLISFSLDAEGRAKR